jgi:predicted enzyme related to lactoylglutathione lyase
MSETSFSFTKLVVDDLAAIELFYGDVFEMKRAHAVRADGHEYALDEVILTRPGAAQGHALIITRYRKRPCPPTGAAWTGFVVSDLNKTLAAVHKAGGRIEVPTHDNPEHGVRAAIVSDPAGHLIEIIQMIPAR